MKLVNVCNNCQIVTAAGKADRAHVIFSYGTPVLAIDCSGMKSQLVRLWDGWSVTTQRHINKAFTILGDGFHMDKKTWDAMPVENLNI